jgi:hydrogenase maturation protein HypF
MDKGEAHKSIIIRLYGVVQGVGFRPFVSRLAFMHGITGSVKNSGGSVVIRANGAARDLDAFFYGLFAQKPPNAEIVHHETEEIPYTAGNSFDIEPSDHSENRIFIPADIAVCGDCMQELLDEKDPRHRHPFISCMSCGPRYSIIERAPYDRETTAMADFPMCPFCEGEYADRKNRRYHAETISCHECGPSLIYRDRDGKLLYRDEAFNQAAEALIKGGVVAVKGIGGYHLACLPADEDAVKRLRLLKKRELKPFAVMFPGMEQLREYCTVTPKEEELLESPARPIVLLPKGGRAFAPSVGEKSRYVGAFLCYTPLQAMLLAACGPLVMTSANISEDPIVKDDCEMLNWESPLLDGILYNERRIAVRLDDSVLKTAAGRVQTIRRSRGYAPLPVVMKGLSGGPQVFAAGGQLKASFCFADAPFGYISQYMGSLESEGNIKEYTDNYARMQKLFRFKPELAVSDMHPAYASTDFAKSLGLPLLQVQHHHAHIASVMAEHGLNEAIGVAFDGTGYGPDGAVWGGEFLVCKGAGYERAGHLKYTTTLNGDEGMKDAAKTALCHLYAAGLEDEITDERWPVVRAALQNGVNVHKNAGMGRLFDAVAAYLGVCAYNRYEAECAIDLENLAAEANRLQIRPVPMAFSISEAGGMWIADALPVWQALRAHKQADRRALSLGFHHAVSDIAVAVCEKLRAGRNISTVALGGGVFQNAVLLEDLIQILEAKGFAVYTNEAVPPNDGGICLGQAFIGLQAAKTTEKSYVKTTGS